MRKLLLALTLAFAFTACNEDESSTGPETGKLNPGAYEFKTTLTADGEQAEFKYQRTLAPGGGLREAILIDGDVYCESKGHWAVEGDMLVMEDTEIRCVADTNGTLSDWQYQGDMEQAIRNITASSFELYASRPASSPFVQAGLKNGWEKYIRTGE